MKKKAKNPNNFTLESSASVAIVEAAEGEKPKQPTFTIDAYNGGALRVGGFYKPIVIDLSGLRSNRVTVLKDHDPSQIVGQGTASISEKNVSVSGVVTGDYSDKNDPAYQVVSHSKNGFVWAASVGVSIDKLDYVAEGENVKVNGSVFQGPLYVVRKGRLGEVSFVGIGADETASAKIAANAAEKFIGENDMKFDEWLQAMGLTQADLNEDQLTKMQAKFDDEQKSSDPDSVKAKQDNDELELRRAEAAAEELRIAEIRKICGSAHGDICAKAIKEGWSKVQAELEVLKAERPKAPAVHESQPVDASPLVMEAALSMSAGFRGLEKAYPAEILEAANKNFKRFTLQQFLLKAAADNGYNVRLGDRIHKGNLRNVLEAAFSSVSVSGILSNIANKVLLASFTSVEQAWRQIAAIRSVNDFKTITSYRLVGGGGYEKVGPGGEIKHGNLGEQSFTNKAETYGEMLAITRQDIINDDMSALTGGAMQKLGRDAGLKLNEVFWTEFLDNSTFFTNGNNNVSGSSALSVSGLKKAVNKFYKLTGPDGKFIGTMPEILLVPVDLEIEAQQLFKDSFVNESAPAGSPAPNSNPHVGKYRPVASRYLSDSTISGHSTTSYYLLANPASLAAIEVVFLDGNETPTVETADADFNTLGIQMRGYHDFGVAKQDPLAGVRANA